MDRRRQDAGRRIPAQQARARKAESANWYRTVLPRMGLALLLSGGIAWVWLHRTYASPTAIQHLLLYWGMWAPVIFMLLDGATTVFFLPGWIFGLAAGVLFGPRWGGLWSLLGATFGATLAFLAARYLASDWVAHHSRGWLKRLVAGVGTGGWRFVALVRLVPLFPFNLSNYGFGLTSVRVAPYVLATLIFQIPGTFAYSYLGYAGRELASGDRHAVQLILYAIGGLAILVVLPSLIHRWRRSGAE